jgi:hypothetical protein
VVLFFETPKIEIQEGMRMTVNTPPAEVRAVVEPVGAAPDSTSRIDWLFRDALRNQQVHPLMDLARRYRARNES